jgi:hypothetical protein
MIESKKRRNIHAEAIRNFDRIQEAVYPERKQCLEDRRFYSIAGAQWEGSLGEQFINKPKFEINKVHLSVIKIFNEYRNNRVTVDFIAKDGVANDDMAEVCDGLFRADERDSGAEEAYDNAFEEAVGGGFGAFRLISEYEDEEDDENEQQRIRIEPIYDADSSVFFDLDAKRQDKADAKYCFVLYSMTPEEFEEEFNEEATSLSKDVDNTEYDWFSPDLVYVAEYYRVEEKKETIMVYKNLTGDEVRYTEDDFESNPELEAELAQIGSTLVREKKVKKRKIHKYIISGSKILEDCGIIAGKHIPIVPVYGKRWFVDSTERCMGHVRLVKDSQRLKNMLTSKLAEISSLSSIEKPIFVPEQMVGHEYIWESDNISNYSFLLVNPITDAAGSTVPSGPIAYTKPPQIPQALSALMQLSDIDMKELLGGSMEADKMLSHVSGKAREMIQKRIDGQAFIYMSNFAKAIRRAGEIWLSMAKEIYVEEGRKMKTVDSMEQVSSIELYSPGISTHGDVSTANDLSKATFDVNVDVGPSSASQREATVQTVQGMLATTQDPETAMVLQSVAMMNMEGDGISDVRDFFRKKLVMMGVVKPTEEERQQMEEAAKNAKPDPNTQALEAMAQEAIAGAKKKEAEVFETLAQTEKIKAETLNTLDEIDLKKLQESRAYLEQVEKLQQQRQQMALQQQQQMVQQTPNVG